MKKIITLVLLVAVFANSYAQKSMGFSYLQDSIMVKVTGIIPNSPALKAGIKINDIITAVDNVSLQNKSRDEVGSIFKNAKDVCNLYVISGARTKKLQLTKTDKASFTNMCLSGNCKNGKGEFIDENAHIYKGDFIDGQKSGQGTLEEFDGKIYIGQWKNGKKNGFGKLTLSNNDVYEGLFLENNFEGKGVFTRSNGNTYTGVFKNSKFEGEVVFYKKEVNKYFNQIYKDGELVAKQTEVVTSTKNVTATKKFGFIDTKGELAIPLKYKEVSDFSEGYAVVLNSSNQLYIIDKKGIETPVKKSGYDISFSFNKPFVFSEGLCAVMSNKKIGFINTKGEEVIACEYEIPLVSKDADNRTVEYLPKFVNGVAVIYKNGKHGVINKTGKLIVPNEYDFITHFEHNLAVFKKDKATLGMNGVMDINGKEIIEPIRYNQNIWIEGANIIRLHYQDKQYSNFYSVYNNKGEQVGEEIKVYGSSSITNYTYLSEFEKGYALYGDKEAPNYWGIVDSIGKKTPLTEKYKFNSNEPTQFKNGYLFATKAENDKMVALNIKGERVNKNCEYDYIHELNKDGIVFGAKGAGNASFYDEKNCKLIYETKLDGKDVMGYMLTTMSNTYPFKGDYAVINKDYANYDKTEKEYNIIDKKGKKTYSVLGANYECKLKPSETETGVFIYNQIGFFDFKKPVFTLYLKGDGTEIYKGSSGSRDFNNGLAAVQN